MTEERRKVNRREDDSCPHDCNICYRYNLQMKWLLAGAAGAMTGLLVLVGIVVNNMNDIGKLGKEQGVTKIQAEYTIASLNEIKAAMGLEVRMPPKLEALKGE